MVNWSIYLVKNFYILIFLQISLIWGIKNEELKVIKTTPNSSSPSLKKTFKFNLFSFSLPYSPLFPFNLNKT